MLGITEDCLALFSTQISFLKVKEIRIYLKIRKIDKGPPSEKIIEQKKFLHAFHYIRLISCMDCKNGYINDIIH